MSRDFEVVIDRIPFSADKANILHNLSVLESEESKDNYRKFVVDTYYQSKNLSNSLFYEDLYPEIVDIHERISYTKHNRVIRNGVKCRYCKGTNTFSGDKRKGGADEYIPTEVMCYDCNRKYTA
jgi:hypothetical protein